MNKKPGAQRLHTEPNIEKLYQTSIRVQGVLWVQESRRKPNRSDIVAVKSQQKIHYHCFKRYRTFPFSFDEVLDENESPSLFGKNFAPVNAFHALKNRNDYMLYCCGSYYPQLTELGSQVITIFYQQLEQIFAELISKGSFSMKMSVLAVGEDFLQDLISRKSVDIREVSNDHHAQTSEAHFSGLQYEEVQTLYQVYSILQATVEFKAKNFLNAHYALYCDFTCKQGKLARRKLVLIDATKDIGCPNKSWDSKSHLVLNKCLLGLFNKMESKDSYCPFRDSKLTRLMKPFLTLNTRVDVYGFLSRDDEETGLGTLNFVKNFSRLKVDALSEENPEESQSEALRAPKQEPSQNRMRTIQNDEDTREARKVSLQAEIQKNADAERKTIVALQKARRLKRLIKTKRWLSRLELDLGDQSAQLQNLSESQIKHEEELENALLEEQEKLERSRVETVEKSASKVEQLKLMKEYFSLAIQAQKDEANEFILEQQVMKQIYEDNIRQIEAHLRKSPRLIMEIGSSPITPHNIPIKRKEIGTIQSANKRNSSYIATPEKMLPEISPLERRKTLVKNKATRGRVDYTHFLEKNTQQYQHYDAAHKQP